MHQYRRRRKAKALLILIMLVLLPLITFLMLEHKAAGSILARAELLAHADAVEILNACIAESIANTDYAGLISREYNESGELTLLLPDTAAINELTSHINLRADEELSRLAIRHIYVNLGVITGSKLLSGLGPAIRVQLKSMGSLRSRLHDEFISVGINQSRHRIYLELCAEIQLILPLRQQKFEVRTDALICESIIIGPIPQTYLHIPALSP